MRFRIGFLTLMMGLPAAAVLVAGAGTGLGARPAGYWQSLSLPAASGLFLQACSLLAALYLAWLWAGLILHALAYHAERSGRHRLSAGLRRLAPRFMRTVAISALNAGLLAGLSATQAPAAMSQQAAGSAAPAGPVTGATTEPAPAAAAATQHTVQVPVPSWLPQHTALPLDRPLGAPATRPDPGPAHRQVIVRPGDTLWDIAQAQLGHQAGLSEIAAYWPRIHAANREAIGPDPNQLLIGTILRLPTLES